ncbi:hypothetical protein [Methylomonas fluvii]|nr:hypothetical protein [Methylomonas fluvii]
MVSEVRSVLKLAFIRQRQFSVCLKQVLYQAISTGFSKHSVLHALGLR